MLQRQQQMEHLRRLLEFIKIQWGHTEFIVGNTETAQRGKITSAQRGNPNHTLKYVLIAAITLVILVSILKQ